MAPRRTGGKRQHERAGRTYRGGRKPPPASRPRLDRDRREDRHGERRGVGEPLVEDELQQRSGVQPARDRKRIRRRPGAEDSGDEEEPRLTPPPRDHQRDQRQDEQHAPGARALRVVVARHRVTPRLSSVVREHHARDALLHELRHRGKLGVREDPAAHFVLVRLRARLHERKELDRTDQQRQNARPHRQRDRFRHSGTRHRDFEESIDAAEDDDVEQ